ncbi:hypothetical protein Nepgr_032034 [Nepenthes gracilis]|uniref:DRBM domain-containing protein n=1 Tax=Nepenthes gracilis TaxID=150966 RepID=A0AAD3TJ88_NEPGR|nr:hypothetical protein Nepgr_032034 [Nepenthes gracilis]
MPKEIAQHEMLLDPEHSQKPQPNLQEVQNQARDQQQSQQERQSILEHLKYKNRLQEYTHRACMQLPVYQTMNERFPHAPKFRSAVLVDGETYTSPNTFSHRKAAEQDAAKHALEGIATKIRDKGCSLICEDTTFCKSILMNLLSR